MKQHLIHTEMIKQVAEKLGPLRPKVVFLGGSATGFHITDKAEPEIRATKDVDIIAEVASRVEYHRLEKRLRELGFFQKMQEDDPICRWYINDVIVDVMPTDENILGFSNRWYLPAMKSSVTIELEENLEIQIATAPYFLGTKLDAFFGRGRGDYLASHDMEDIINFINGRVEILEEIKNSEPDLKDYIIKSLKGFLGNEFFLEALPGHLLPDQASQGRRSIILARIKNIVDLGNN
jgi:predicted nucleotidyltransferase